MTEESNPNPNNEENNENHPLDKFEDIKTKYEETISNKDKEIEELKKKLSAKDKEVDTTIQNLNDEVNTKLKQDIVLIQHITSIPRSSANRTSHF